MYSQILILQWVNLASSFSLALMSYIGVSLWSIAVIMRSGLSLCRNSTHSIQCTYIDECKVSRTRAAHTCYSNHAHSVVKFPFRREPSLYYPPDKCSHWTCAPLKSSCCRLSMRPFVEAKQMMPNGLRAWKGSSGNNLSFTLWGICGCNSSGKASRG